MFQIPLMCQYYFSCISKMLKIFKIFIKRTCIYMEQRQRFIFVRYFNAMYFFNIIIFKIRNIFVIIIYGFLLLNWFTKSSEFSLNFNNNELFWALFTKVALNTFMFVMDIFCIGPTRKLGIIVVTARHQVAYYTQHLS